MSNATLPTSLATLLAALPELARAHAAPAEPGAGAVSASLPPAVAGRCRVERDGDRLVLLAETSAIAQIVRFHGPRLVRELGASDFTVRVQTLKAPPARASTLPPPSLSPEAARVLQDAARHCDHAPLAAALERLASLAGSESDQKD